MSVRFKILGSSSRGNAALLATPETQILIDAGFSGKQIEARMAAVDESIDNVAAVFLTHEHSDHSMGVRGLTRRNEGMPFFANRDTAREVQSRLKRRANWKLFETGATFTFRDIEITSFSLPHDAVDPVGYLFRTGDGSLDNPYHTVAWVTDLGYAPTLVHEKIRDADILVLESNHDVTMLDESDRAWSLKQRIKSRHGHLSNDAAKDLLEGIENPRWSQVYLAHLSEECNCVNLVKETFASLSGAGQNFRVDVIDPCSTVMGVATVS